MKKEEKSGERRVEGEESSTVAHAEAESESAREEKSGERRVDGGESPTVAHADAEEVTMKTDAELQAEMNGKAPQDEEVNPANLAATARPTGEVSVMVPAEGNDEYVTRAELESLIEEAYMRGLNEAVTKQIIADTTMGHEIGEMSEDLAGLFAVRPSVWE